MRTEQIVDKIFTDIKTLEGQILEYLSGANTVSVDAVNIQQHYISGSKGDGSPVNVDLEKVRLVADAFSRSQIVNIDALMQGSGNVRSAFEAMLANLPNVGYLPANKPPNTGPKKIVWFDEPVHAAGTVFDACERLLAQRATAQAVELRNLVMDFITDVSERSGLRFNEETIHRFMSSLCAKRFAILGGLSGSGKTKLAQAIAKWMSPTQGKYYSVITVGADWTSSENILGYPDGLDAERYVSKPALELFLDAAAHPNTPHFLILDEMNLSHVERYFSDLLSVIESGDKIVLYEGGDRRSGDRVIPKTLDILPNVFIIGTVNVDETTYMFSPKVLDRAFVLDFTVSKDDVRSFVENPRSINLDAINGLGSKYSEQFLRESQLPATTLHETVRAHFEQEMLLYFSILQEHHSEFGFRIIHECARFLYYYSVFGGYPEGNTDWIPAAMDAIIIEKILPKLHGSRSKLEGLLWALAWACGAERIERDGKSFDEQLTASGRDEVDGTYSPDVVWASLAAVNAENPSGAAPYPLSFDKIMRMWRKLVRDQFVSFSEA